MFKVGDKVRLVKLDGSVTTNVSAHWGQLLGRVGTVVEVPELPGVEFFDVKFDEKNTFPAYPHELEKVS